MIYLWRALTRESASVTAILRFLSSWLFAAREFWASFCRVRSHIQQELIRECENQANRIFEFNESEPLGLPIIF